MASLLVLQPRDGADWVRHGADWGGPFQFMRKRRYIDLSKPKFVSHTMPIRSQLENRNSNMDLEIDSGSTFMCVYTITPSQSLKPITLQVLASSDGDRYIWSTRCEPTLVQRHRARSVWVLVVELMTFGSVFVCHVLFLIGMLKFRY